MTVTYHGDNPKVKLQIKYVPDEETVYTYNLSGGAKVMCSYFPGETGNTRSLSMKTSRGTGILRPLREPARWP